MANIRWMIKKAKEFQKNIYFCFSDYAKAFGWITENCGKYLKWWAYQTTWTASWEICVQVKKQQLELNMKQQTVSKSGKEYVYYLIDCILWPCSFNLHTEYIIQNTGLDEAQAGIKIAGRNLNNLTYEDDTTLMAESEEEL